MRCRITYRPAGLPVDGYLRPQARFAHLGDAEIAVIQAEVDRRWARLLERAARPDSPPSTTPHAAYTVTPGACRKDLA